MSSFIHKNHWHINSPRIIIHLGLLHFQYCLFVRNRSILMIKMIKFICYFQGIYCCLGEGWGRLVTWGCMMLLSFVNTSRKFIVLVIILAAAQATINMLAHRALWCNFGWSVPSLKSVQFLTCCTAGLKVWSANTLVTTDMPMTYQEE